MIKNTTLVLGQGSEIGLELLAAGVLGHAIVIVGAAHHHIVAVLQARTNGRSSHYFRHFVGEFRNGIGCSIRVESDILWNAYSEMAPCLRVSHGALDLGLLRSCFLRERARVAGLRPWYEAEMI